ncbi:hypothetical protein ScPMuIL_016246 [Solemya velum]
MDVDSNDGNVAESLNGETKPDVAKLAQTAIIKQDVMLSATSTQSPLAAGSSVFTIPTVSMPTVSMASSSNLGGLQDHLFMSVPSVSENSATHSVNEVKPEQNALTSLSSQSQLFGQPQVAAPQFFLTGQPLQSQTAGTTSIPVQQLLIPVSTGNGTQQFISIPVSLATGGNQQIQLLTTSNGQIIATNLANLTGLTHTQSLNASAALTGSGGSLASHTHNSNSPQQTGSHALSNQIAALPSLLTTGNQGQILAVSPQMVNMTAAQVTTCATSPTGQATQPTLSQLSSPANLIQTSSVTTSLPLSLTNHSSLTSPPSQPKVASIIPQSIMQTTTTDGLPPNVSQLLPNTVGNCTESTTVDGINLDEIKEFAKQFKIRRLSLGLTQTQVGQALSATEGPAYSQSAICRFEKLDITPKSAQKIKPVLERWMLEAEERYKNGMQNLTEFIGSEPSKKRKRRTSFTPGALEVLGQFFERNTHPSGAEMTELSEKLNYDREVIRVWFCNKRQALKNTIKKLKQDTP